MIRKTIIFYIFIFIISIPLTGCGGGAAAGLLGVAIENATDNDNSTPVPTVSLSISGKVPTSTTPNPFPVKNNMSNFYFAKDTGTIYLLDSQDGLSYATIETGIVTLGKYNFTYNFPTNVEHFLKVKSSITGDDMFIGKLANNISSGGTIEVPITFDTMAVILTKTIEAQNAQKYILCGDLNLKSMKTSSMAWVMAKIDMNLDDALTKIKKDKSRVTLANLNYDVLGSSLDSILATSSNAFKWDLGPVILDNEAKTTYDKQYLFMNSNSKTFTFTLYNSDTDSVSLNGTYTYGTDSVEFTISNLTNFPTDTTIFKTRDGVGEKFKVTSLKVENSSLVSGKLDDTLITMEKVLITN